MARWSLLAASLLVLMFVADFGQAGNFFKLNVTGYNVKCYNKYVKFILNIVQH